MTSNLIVSKKHSLYAVFSSQIVKQSVFVCLENLLFLLISGRILNPLSFQDSANTN